MPKPEFNRSFASHEKAQYWSDLNDVKPDEVFKCSHVKYWFDCDKCDHSFENSLNNVNSGYWCAYCSNKKICCDENCDYCHKNSFASHEKAQYWNIYNGIEPYEVSRCSHTKYWFDCNECEHSFEIPLKNIVLDDHWCTYCSNQKLCDEKECEECYYKSFAKNDKAKYWSDKNSEKPRNIFPSNKNKYFFDCHKCGHVFLQRISDISFKGSWCIFCSGSSLCENDECKFCAEKSFASCNKSEFWSDKNDEKPRNVYKMSNDKYIFNCNVCCHEFSQRLSGTTNGNWCPFCADCELCDDNNCKICFDKSFASQPKVIFWSKTNTVKPRDVFKKSRYRYLFNCDKCNKEFSQVLNCVANDVWCPFCINKTEKILYDFLLNIYADVQHRFAVNWCKNINCLPFDFVLNNSKIIIELDGNQHFKQIMGWKSPKENQKTDKFKMNRAINNEYSVIRILQEDVYHNKYNWQKELPYTIEKVKKSKKVQIVYMCKNNEYDIYLDKTYESDSDSDEDEKPKKVKKVKAKPEPVKKLKK